MKSVRFGILLVGLAVSLSLIHTAAAAEVDTPTVRYAEELSAYTDLAYYDGAHAARYIDFKMRFPGCSWQTIITDVEIGLDTPYFTDPAEIKGPGETDVLVNKYRYLPAGFVPDDLEKVNSAYCFKSEMLAHDARVAFEQLCADARALGYTLYATSAYRSYNRQLQLYQTYGIPDVTTARPGHSEHQTGMAVDVIHTASGSNASLTQSAVYRWYAEHAHEYGFIIRYKDQWRFLTGYDGEPWHLRYLGVELATAVKNSYLTYDEYYTRYVGIPNVSGNSTDAAVGVSGDVSVEAGGTTFNLSAFSAAGHTHFKLRDIGIILSGTNYEFNVTWNAETGHIGLQPGTPYASEPTLSELTPGLVRHMMAAKPPIKIGEELYEPGALMVAGSNYYTLETLGALMDFTVTTSEDGTLVIASAFAEAA